MKKLKYSVSLSGSFHSFELLDERGREVFDLEEAKRVAKLLYEDEARSVYNGVSSFDFEDEDGEGTNNETII